MDANGPVRTAQPDVHVLPAREYASRTFDMSLGSGQREEADILLVGREFLKMQMKLEDGTCFFRISAAQAHECRSTTLVTKFENGPDA